PGGLVHKRLAVVVSVVLIIITCDTLVLADSRKDPLTRTEVLALLAGGVFSENVVHDIEMRGLAFTADDNFNSLATAAGADAKVIAALAKAKGASSPGDSLSEQASLQHLSYAGSLIRSGDNDGAM